MNLEKVLEHLREIAIVAGKEIMAIYDQPELFNTELKGDDSPLTAADRSANTIICEALEKYYPNIPIISEENKEIPYEERKNFEWCWLVDPLDGTKEFVKRNGEFTVNIALLHNEKSIAGVVYAPVTKELYSAGLGFGAFKQLPNTNPEKLQTNSFSKKQKSLKLVSSRSHMNDETKAFVDSFDCPELVAKGSSFKFMLIADNEAHIYPRLAPTMEWDTGAAQIILEEAGGSVIDQNTNQPLTYNKESLRNPYFIAYGNIED